MKALMFRATQMLCCARSLPPLFFRLALAYGFYHPAVQKLSSHEATAQMFANLGIPFASASAYLVAVVEALAVPLLILGLGTRWISMLLWVIMMVAIFGVHVPTQTDFTTALWFALGLFSLMVTGPGRYSLDYPFCFCEKAARSKCHTKETKCDSKASLKPSCCGGSSSTKEHDHHHGDSSTGGCCRH